MTAHTATASMPRRFSMQRAARAAAASAVWLAFLIAIGFRMATICHALAPDVRPAAALPDRSYAKATAVVARRAGLEQSSSQTVLRTSAFLILTLAATLQLTRLAIASTAERSALNSSMAG